MYPLRVHMTKWDNLDGGDVQTPSASRSSADKRQSLGDMVEAVERELPSLRELVERDGKHIGHLSGTSPELRCDHPVHGSESGGNFLVNVDKGLWSCKRCSSGGDKLSWIAVDEGIIDCADAQRGKLTGAKFMETLAVAAEIANVPLDSGDVRQAAQMRAAMSNISAVFHDAAEWAHEQADRRKVLDGQSLLDRVSATYGLSRETLDDNLVGYVPPGGTKLYDHLVEQGWSHEQICETGLCTTDGRDRFECRVLFPYWHRGDIVYFIGRKTKEHPGWDNPKVGKYIKLPKHETAPEVSEYLIEPIFGKDTAVGRDRVIVTEGITDCMALHQAGFAAVSPVTIHFSRRKVDEVSQALYGKDVTVVMDYDPESGAGLRGACRTAAELARSGKPRTVSVAQLEGGDEKVDMADFLKEADSPSDALRDVLSNSVPALVAQYLWGDDGRGDGDVEALYEYAIEVQDYSPECVYMEKDSDGEWQGRDLTEALRGVDSLSGAYKRIEKLSDMYKPGISGKARIGMYSEVMWWGLHRKGDLFRASDNRIYFMTNDHVVMPVDDGRRGITRTFEDYLRETFGITPADFGRTAFEILRNRLETVREVPTHDMFMYNREDNILFVSDQDRGYYVLDGSGEVEWRPNGTDVFFLPNDTSEPWRYIDDLPEPPGELFPGELALWRGEGDWLMRTLCNRVNYSDRAVLGPMDQRIQLYLHLHAIPFGEAIPAKPIMAWCGTKGSGKTHAQRAIGRVFHGEGWFETRTPESVKEFNTMVANSSFVFVDNYDEGMQGANDVLAAVATGSPLSRRELYTTADSVTLQSNCWLSLTSRDPPFRRDDVADRCLVFRVDRPTEFVPEMQYQQVAVENRDEILTQLVDNCDRILAHLAENGTEGITTDHRMSEWAVHAQVTAEVLGIECVDEVLGRMKKERAYFSLEKESFTETLLAWSHMPDGPEQMSKWYESALLSDILNDVSMQEDIPLDVSTGRGVASKLTAMESELVEYFGLEVRERKGKPNLYRFTRSP